MISSSILSILLMLPDSTSLNNPFNHLREPAAIAQSFPDFSDPTVMRLLQAEDLLNLGFTDDGLKLFEQHLNELHAQHEYLREAELLSSIAAGFERRGELQNALIYYQRALTLYNSSDIPETVRVSQFVFISEAANAVGSLYLTLGEPDQALAAYEQALAIARSVQSSWTEADTLSNMAVVYRVKGQPEQALATYQQALSLYQQTEESIPEASRVWNQIGLIYAAQGKFDQALAAYQQGLNMLNHVEAADQLAAQILTLENISHLYQQQGQTEAANQFAQRAETALQQAFRNDIAASGNEVSRQANVLQNIGEYYLLNRQPEPAKSYFDRAVAIARQSPGYPEANILGSITLAYTRMAQFEQALPYEEGSVAVFRAMGLSENTATSLRLLAEMYQAAERWEQALATFQQALMAAQANQQEYGGVQPREFAQIFQHMGQIYEHQQQWEQAATAYQRSLAHYQEASFPYGEIFVLERLAGISRMQGQDAQAQQYAQQAQTLRNELNASSMQTQ